MNFLKGAFIFLAGVCVGAGGMYLYDKRDFEERVAIEKADLEEAKEHYYNKVQKYKDLTAVDQISKEEGYISYDSSSKKKEVLVDRIKDIQEKALENEHPNEDYPEEPIMIDEVEYSEHEVGYFEKMLLDYYLDDGALVNENDELMVIEDVIGFDNLDAFLKDDSSDTMYIRNGRLSTDYAVTKVSGSYSEIVGLGGDEDDD